jgi:hypothetical protein
MRVILLGLTVWMGFSAYGTVELSDKFQPTKTVGAPLVPVTYSCEFTTNDEGGASSTFKQAFTTQESGQFQVGGTKIEDPQRNISALIEALGIPGNPDPGNYLRVSFNGGTEVSGLLPGNCRAPFEISYLWCWSRTVLNGATVHYGVSCYKQ